MLALRIGALALVYVATFAIVSAALIPPPAGAPAADPATSLGALLAVCVLDALVLAYVARRSRWSGWKLAAALFVVLWGVTAVMPQIESAFFLTRLPAGMVPRLVLMGALVAAIVAPAAAWLLGRWRPAVAGVDESVHRLDMPAREWAVRLAVVVVLYLGLYFGFGYYVAWKNPAVQAYYGGTDPGSFAAQLSNVVRDTPMLVPLQVLRALMWAALAVPVIRMTRGAWWHAALAVALLFSVVMNSQLLLPNPYMPADVRMAHLAETATSNFLFGWLLVLALLWRARTTEPPVGTR
jgi:hypothetical protein